MQVEQDTLPISARSFSNEFSHQHSQSLIGSRSYDQNVNIYSETPYPNAYMLFDYNNHNGAQFDYDLRTLNEPPANTCNWSDQYSEPAQHFTEIDDSRSNLTSSYEHRSSGHPSSGFLSRSHESTRRSINHPHDVFIATLLGHQTMTCFARRYRIITSKHLLTYTCIPTSVMLLHHGKHLGEREITLTRRSHAVGLRGSPLKPTRQENVGSRKVKAWLAKIRTMSSPVSVLQRGRLQKSKR